MADPIIPGQDVALFIDWENFKISLATGRRQPNVSSLKEEVSNLGRVVVARAYADWVTRAPELRGASQFINDPPALYAAGIEPVYVPTRLSWGSPNSTEPQRQTRVKNSVDVKMTADCIECAHAYANIGTFVLVSGDSDFIHVVNTLRTMGKRVVIIGVSWATSRRLADQVDGLILYDQDVDPVVPVVQAPEVPAVPVEPALTGNGREQSRNGVPDLAAVIQEIEEIVRTERPAAGSLLLTSIKQRLLRKFPRFDEKQLGYSGFKKLMARVAQEGNIRLTTVGLVDWATLADEPDPPAPSEPAEEAEDPEEPSEETPPPAARGRRRRLPSIRRGKAAEEPPAEATDAAAPEADAETPGTAEAEAVETAGESQEAQPMSAGLEASLADATSGLDLPQGPGDGQDAPRVADLIIMADSLEHREGISHVAFNFLVGEVCQALEQGLESGHDDITRRWGEIYSRAYVSRMFRGLSDGNLFQRGWHSWRDEVSGHSRRRRTFNLDRSHAVVNQVLTEHWRSGEAAESPPPEAPPTTAGHDEDADAPEDPGLTGGENGQMTPEETAEAREAAGFLSRLFHPRD